MRRITINNYQYWFNLIEEVVYLDEKGRTEVDRKLLTAQEKDQLYWEVRRVSQVY